jgi:tRNA (guanine-N7-)-methyltransferase
VVQLIPESYCERLDLPKIFGRSAPLEVDLGCGDGAFVFALAARMPGKNFLGIERLSGRVAKACRKAEQIENLRILHLETSYAVDYLLPPESVEIFHLLFPDPWPKRRHHRQRIVTKHFLDSILRALEPNGILRIATDHFDYFQEIERLASSFVNDSRVKLDGFKPSSSGRFEVVDSNDADSPITTFETKFRADGAPIHRLALRKVSPVM